MITDYIIWNHGAPKLTVSEHAFIKSHPLQEFINNNKELVSIVPEVITHYINSQRWVLSRDGVDENIADYIPSYFKQEDNIE